MSMVVRFARNDEGVTLVEFALVMPVLVLVIVACLDFARALNAYVTVANAAREGARYASVNASADKSVAEISDSVRAYLSTRVAPLDPTALGVSVALGAADPRWSPDAPAPTEVTVTVSYEWHSSTWLVGSFFAATSGSPTFALSSTMEAMR